MLCSKSAISTKDKRGAIVLGGDAQGLGIARALGECDIPVIIFSWEYGIAKFSRYVQREVKIPPPWRQKEYLSAIRKYIREFNLKGWIAYPTDDDSVLCIAKFGKELGLTTWGVNSKQHDAVVDKLSFSRLANRFGLKVPYSLLFTEVDRKADIVFPAVIKPRVKEPFVRITKKKAIRVNSFDELQLTVKKMNSAIPKEHLVIQELIPGRGQHQLSYAALFWDGNPLAELVACRKRQHPSDFGRASTYVYTVEDEEVHIIGRKVLSELGYTGLAEVEFKRHSNTGELYLLEVNPRTWGWHTLVRAAHGNWIAWLHAILDGEEPLIPSSQVQASWVKLITDLPTAFLELIKGEVKLRDLIRDYYRRPMAFASLDKKDFIPFIMEWFLIPYLSMKRGY